MRRHLSGFTLLEVLVAISVFAIMSSLAYAGLTRMLEGRDRIEAERALWRNVALAMVQIEDDLAQARDRSVRDNSGVKLGPFLGQPVDPRPLGPASMEFTRGGLYLAPESDSPDMQRVAYRLMEGKLTRQAWPALDRPPVSEPTSSGLLTNIDNLTVRFHTPGGSWVDRWPDAINPKPMPDAVELAFDLVGIGRITRVLLVGQ